MAPLGEACLNGLDNVECQVKLPLIRYERDGAVDDSAALLQGLPTRRHPLLLITQPQIFLSTGMLSSLYLDEEVLRLDSGNNQLTNQSEIEPDLCSGRDQMR